jgi:transcriptional regulator with XRE-family HTH domain
VSKTGPLARLGRALVQARLKSDLTQEEVGERVGLHRNEVGAVERGEKNVSFINLLRLCRALRVVPSDLLSGFDEKSLRRLPAKRQRTRHTET